MVLAKHLSDRVAGVNDWDDPVTVLAAWEHGTGNHAAYSQSVWCAVSEIWISILRLFQVTALLSSSQSRLAAAQAGVRQADFIILLAEDSALRAVGVFDRVLVALNAVFALGNAPENCLRHVIMKNAAVLESPVIKPLKQLQSFADRRRKERDALVHRSGYLDLDIGLLAVAESAPETGANAVKDHLALEGVSIATYVAELVDDQVRLNTEADKLARRVLDALLPEYLKRYERMQSAAGQRRAS